MQHATESGEAHAKQVPHGNALKENTGSDRLQSNRNEKRGE